jgi:hypothetical protein
MAIEMSVAMSRLKQPLQAGVLLPVAVGAEQDALVQFRLDLLKGSGSAVGEIELLHRGIEVVQVKATDISVVATMRAAATQVFDHLLLQPLLPLYRLAIGADPAVRRWLS